MKRKHRRNQWPNIYPRPYSSGEQGWTVDCGVINGKRDRETFDTEAAAEERAEQRRWQRKEEGRRGFELPLEIRVEAAACVKKLEPYPGATLTAAVDHYITCELVHRESPTINKMVDDLLKEKEKAGLRPSALQALESFCTLFAERFGDRQLHTVGLSELKEVCLATGFAPRTQWNRIRFASQLYLHAKRQGWLDTNLTERIPKPLWDAGEPGILLVGQASSLLHLAPKFELLSYVAIGLFAGVRRSELLRLDWHDVKRADREIVIGARIAKGRGRRVISYGDALAAWLDHCARDEGPVVEVRGLEKRFQQLRRAAGIEVWPHNALRHSYASYHLAFNKDEMRTAYNMGHRGTTDTLHGHYKGLVSTADAERFWQMLPGAKILVETK